MSFTLEKKIGMGFVFMALLQVGSGLVVWGRTLGRLDEHEKKFVNNEVRISSNTAAMNDFRSFKEQGPRVTPDQVELARINAVATAVQAAGEVSAAQISKLENKIDTVSGQNVELRVMVAGLITELKAMRREAQN